MPSVPCSGVHAMFSDVASFATLSAALKAEEVGSLILRMLSKFDLLCKNMV